MILGAFGARVVVLAAFSACVARCGMCEPDEKPRTVPSASASATVAPPMPSVAPSGALGNPGGRAIMPPKLACRAIAVDGDVHIESPTGADAGLMPVLLQGLVPTEGWLGLAAGSRLVAKDPRTSRESTFRGPARVRACVEYREESWVALGAFDSASGAGETPGAEEWIVTPLGVVRYSAASLSVDVRKSDVKASVTSGAAFLWAADDVAARGPDGGAPARTDDGWLRADGGTVGLASANATTLDGARGALARCSALGKAAHDLSATLLAGGADAGTVTAQVSTRRQAKAACAVAGLRLAALSPRPGPDALSPLEKALADGNAGWNTLPTPPPAP
jgi:hypothetical protein